MKKNSESKLKTDDEKLNPGFEVQNLKTFTHEIIWI